MGLLSNLQWNVTKPRARFSAELQAPLQPAAAPPDAVPPETPLPEKKYPPGHTTKHLQSWKLHKELTLQDAFSSWEIQEVFFSSHSSQNRCVRSACIFFIYFFFSPQISPKEPWGWLLPVVPTHLQWLIITMQAPTPSGWHQDPCVWKAGGENPGRVQISWEKNSLSC